MPFRPDNVEGFVNGVRATDIRLAPGWTQYEKRVQYQAYDVTALLQPGDNVVAALLGDGWYCGTISRIATPPGVCGWGWTPQFRAELRLEYADGAVETIGTDTSWSSFFLRPATLENDLYHGEEYDATVDDEAWKLPGFKERAASVSPVREGGGKTPAKSCGTRGRRCVSSARSARSRGGCARRASGNSISARTSSASNAWPSRRAMRAPLSPSADARRRAAALLADDIRARGVHLSTGFLGTPVLLDALEAAGETSLAYALLEQTSCPSWLYPVTQGATTIWERWDAVRDGVFHESWMNSLNHYAFGSAAAWLYKTVCGIRNLAEEDPSAAGWKRFRLAPLLGGSLAFAEARLDTPYGEIASRWERTSDGVAYVFTVPANTTAELVLPGEKPLALPPGAHRFARPA